MASVGYFGDATALLDSGIIGWFFPHFSEDASLPDSRVLFCLFLEEWFLDYLSIDIPLYNYNNL
jgi:hypothetical protein